MKSIWTIRTLGTLGIVISGCLLATLAGAQPFIGGLPQCIAETNQCQVDLTTCSQGQAACQGNLATCDTMLATCSQGQAACQGNLATCVTTLQACQDELSRVGTCDSDADCPTGNACVDNQCVLRLPYCSDDPNTLTPGRGRYIVTSDLLTINCLPYVCVTVSLGPSSQFAECGIGGHCQSDIECYFEAGYDCNSDGHCVP